MGVCVWLWHLFSWIPTLYSEFVLNVKRDFNILNLLIAKVHSLWYFEISVFNSLYFLLWDLYPFREVPSLHITTKGGKFYKTNVSYPKKKYNENEPFSKSIYTYMAIYTHMSIYICIRVLIYVCIYACIYASFYKNKIKFLPKKKTFFQKYMQLFFQKTSCSSHFSKINFFLKKKITHHFFENSWHDHLSIILF